MKFFVDLGVRKKLILVFSVVLIFIVLIGFKGIISSASINNNANLMYSNNLTSVKDLEEINVNITAGREALTKIVLEKDISKIDGHVATIADLTQKNENLKIEYESTNSTSEERKVYDDFKNELTKYRELRTKIIDFAKANNYDEANKLYISDVNSITNSMTEKLEKCININKQSAYQANLDNITKFNKVKYTI